MAKPVVSVVIISYNRDYYIMQAIESIIKQSFHDWELIIVLDGSNDESAKKIQKIKDKRVKLIALKQNFGIAHARNIASQIAKGEFIAILDDDDIARPERLHIQLQIFKSRPELSVISGSMNIFYDDKRESGYADSTRELEHDMIAAGMFLNCAIANPTSMYRRNIISELGFHYDEELKSGEDFDLWLRILMNVKPAPRFFAHKDIVIDYRRHAGAMSKSILVPWFSAIRDKIYMQALNRLDIYPSTEDFKIYRALTDHTIKFNQPEDVRALDGWINIIRDKNKKHQIFDDKSLIQAIAGNIHKCAENSKIPYFTILGFKVDIQNLK